MSILIKYAVQELKVEGGFLSHYQEVTKGFIISKCQVLEDRKVYYSEENFLHKYVVHFPYSRFDDFCTWLKKNPNYHYYYEENKIPSRRIDSENTIVHKIYDTYEEAIDDKDRNNNNLMNSLLFDTSYEGYKKIKAEFESTMLLCSEYEKFIYENMKKFDISSLKLDDGDTLKLVKNIRYSCK